jgi:hypothetical protein
MDFFSKAFDTDAIRPLIAEELACAAMVDIQKPFDKSDNVSFRAAICAFFLFVTGDFSFVTLNMPLTPSLSLSCAVGVSPVGQSCIARNKTQYNTIQ